MNKRMRNIIKDKKGVALLLVLCLFALLTCLGLSILFASVSALSSAAQDTAYRQAYLSAYSASEILREEMERKGSGIARMAAELKLDEQEYLEIETKDFPDDLGVINGKFIKTRDQSGTLTITVMVGKSEYNLTGVYNYTKDEEVWACDGYQPME